MSSSKNLEYQVLLTKENNIPVLIKPGKEKKKIKLSAKLLNGNFSGELSFLVATDRVNDM